MNNSKIHLKAEASESESAHLSHQTRPDPPELVIGQSKSDARKGE